MRSLVDGRVDRVALFDDGNGRFRELRAALARSALEVSVLPRLLHESPISPPPDVIVVPGAPGQPVVHALDEHPVLRWSELVVVPWEALVDGVREPLRVDSLLKAVREALARRLAVLAELASGRRALHALEPVGPVPFVLAAARTLGTTLVIEGEDVRARLAFAHGRFVGGRATDGAGLRTVRGLEALAVALRTHDAEIFFVADEEDEPIGTPIEDALAAALVARPTFELGRGRARRSPRVLAIPERLEEPDERLSHAETGRFPSVERATPPTGAAPSSAPPASAPPVSGGLARTRPYPAVARREAAVLLDATRLWHPPIDRAPDASRTGVTALVNEDEIDVVVDEPVPARAELTDVLALAAPPSDASVLLAPRGMLAPLALAGAAVAILAAVALLSS